MTDLSNNPRPIDLLRERVDDLAGAADQWLAKVPEITDADTAARAVDFDEQLLRAYQATDKQRAEERKPFMDGAAAVQEVYNPLLQRVTICRGLLGKLLTGWKRREQMRLDAERADRERQAAEARRKAEEAAKCAEQPKTVADVERAQRALQAAQDAEKAVASIPERAQVRGAISGRARSLRREWRVTQVTDEVELYIWLTKEHGADLTKVMLDFAQRSVRAGARDIPGVKIEQVEV